MLWPLLAFLKLHTTEFSAPKNPAPHRSLLTVAFPLTGSTLVRPDAPFILKIRPKVPPLQIAMCSLRSCVTLTGRKIDSSIIVDHPVLGRYSHYALEARFGHSHEEKHIGVIYKSSSDGSLLLYGGRRVICRSGPEATFAFAPNELVSVSKRDKRGHRSCREIHARNFVYSTFETGSAIGEPTHTTVSIRALSSPTTDPVLLSVRQTDDYGNPAGNSVWKVRLSGTPLPRDPLPSVGRTSSSGNTTILVQNQVAEQTMISVSTGGPYPRDRSSWNELVNFRPGPPHSISLHVAPLVQVGSSFRVHGVVRDVVRRSSTL